MGYSFGCWVQQYSGENRNKTFTVLIAVSGEISKGFLLQNWRQALKGESKLDLEVTQELRKRICLLAMKNSRG